jgi:hypothetical protein
VRAGHSARVRSHGGLLECIPRLERLSAGPSRKQAFLVRTARLFRDSEQMERAILFLIIADIRFKVHK